VAHGAGMIDKQTSGVVDAATKTAGKVIDAVSSPVLITMLLVFGGLVASLMFLWNAQSERNRELWVNLVAECVPNNYDKQ
jgi:hypothetical protein